MNEAGAGRGGQGGPSVKDLDEDYSKKLRIHKDAMDAWYDSNAKMLGLTKQEYIKQQSAKEAEARKNAPIGEDSQYKKGGSVKGWGKARGARKAKMY